MRPHEGIHVIKGSSNVSLEDESMSYQLVGGVMAYQDEDG